MDEQQHAAEKRMPTLCADQRLQGLHFVDAAACRLHSVHLAWRYLAQTNREQPDGAMTDGMTVEMVVVTVAVTVVATVVAAAIVTKVAVTAAIAELMVKDLVLPSHPSVAERWAGTTEARLGPMMAVRLEARVRHRRGKGCPSQ